jgi:type IX secretion system PorP/SprF family membrane protein
MRKVLLALGLSLTALVSFGQQDPQFSQNMFVKLPVNPGYAGTSGAICATAIYRTQWMNFPGSPKTILFAIDAPIPALHGGAGLTIVNDKLGNFNFMHARAAYSFHKPLGQTGLLGIGLEAGIIQATVQDKWLAPDGTDGTLDEAIPNDKVSKMTFDIGLGAYYRTQQLYVGLSASHIPGKAESLKATDFNYQAARHYYVLAGYDFFLTSTLTLRPSVHVKSDAAVTTFDANINLLWNNMIWGGVSYRLQDAILPHLGFAWEPNQKSTLKIGYAYDLGISGLKSYHKNTHEILVNYCIKFTPKVKIQSHINPRFLR